MEVILIFSDGRAETIEISTKKTPRIVALPSLFGGARAEFEHNGTSADGLPIYGDLSAEIPTMSSVQ